MHFDNKNKNILVLPEGSTQGLADATITAENKYLINYPESERRILIKSAEFQNLLL